MRVCRRRVRKAQARRRTGPKAAPAPRRRRRARPATPPRPRASPSPARLRRRAPAGRGDRRRDAAQAHGAHEQVEGQQQREDGDALVIKGPRHRAADVAGHDAHERGGDEADARALELLSEKVGHQRLGGLVSVDCSVCSVVGLALRSEGAGRGPQIEAGLGPTASGAPWRAPSPACPVAALHSTAPTPTHAPPRARTVLPEKSGPMSTQTSRSGMVAVAATSAL